LLIDERDRERENISFHQQLVFQQQQQKINFSFKKISIEREK
jgi:hypothetical protein